MLLFIYFVVALFSSKAVGASLAIRPSCSPFDSMHFDRLFWSFNLIQFVWRVWLLLPILNSKITTRYWLKLDCLFFSSHSMRQCNLNYKKSAIFLTQTFEFCCFYRICGKFKSKNSDFNEKWAFWVEIGVGTKSTNMLWFSIFCVNLFSSLGKKKESLFKKLNAT